MKVTIIKLINHTSWGSYPATLVTDSMAVAALTVGERTKKIELCKYEVKKPSNGEWEIVEVLSKDFDGVALPPPHLRFICTTSAGGAFGSGVDYKRVRLVADLRYLFIIAAGTDTMAHFHVPPEMALAVLEWVKANNVNVYLANSLGNGYETYAPEEQLGESKKHWYIPYN